MMGTKGGEKLRLKKISIYFNGHCIPDFFLLYLGLLKLVAKNDAEEE